MSVLKASAPGSVMLMGEHAVLAGHPAIILSLKERIHVTLTLQNHGKIEIDSDFGHLVFPIDNFPAPFPPAHRYVLQCLKDFVDQYPGAMSGLHLNIRSDFALERGLGSSTAVSVALWKALAHLIDLRPSSLFSFALKSIRSLQTYASGADVAASLFEGCLFYQQEKAQVIEACPQIVWEFSGIKVPSKKAIESVLSLESDYRLGLFELIHQGVEAGRSALMDQNVADFAEILKRQQRYMERLFLDTPELKNARARLANDPSVLATKISGAGLGDGVIGFRGF